MGIWELLGLLKEEESPLPLAALMGNVDEVQALLAQGINVDSVSNSRSALFNAVTNNHLDVVDALIAAGADLNFGGPNMAPPLAIAIKLKRLGAAKKLLAAGATVDIIWDNRSALTLAVGAEYIPMIQLLIDAKADLNSFRVESPPPISMAIYHKSPALLQLLLDAGAEVDVPIFNGATALMSAAGLGMTELVQMLLAAGANVNARTDAGGNSLVQTAMTKNVEIVKLLLEASARVDDFDDTRRTALFHAAEDGHLETLELLLDASADPDRCDENGQSALCAAAEKGHANVVERLLQAGADIHKCSSVGTSPLHAAASGGHVRIVQMLLTAGAYVDRSKNGPLALAIEKGNHNVVLLLCEAIVARAKQPRPTIVLPPMESDENDRCHAVDGEDEA
ncbi:hypothetical protein SDRG_14776 [Saprolegnia diclina VS20]|uniref:Uncharacterized protein n=1 Tax=Saprolegnia diclina (strain VS20) TaxID=1156394 RepID=T0RD28_SAPDV|nr:hypothetical protein SDRG_14776 [Saprolegnia diclina VS20]EQC27452.1 hypothetical protein SDRG_14776 [Saprolegnia diclina VS20]|eukprot:XP_008619152.1 hypothetical protein SDRG_14776 [Saprolegnia diclina VS20]